MSESALVAARPQAAPNDSAPRASELIELVARIRPYRELGRVAIVTGIWLGAIATLVLVCCVLLEGNLSKGDGRGTLFAPRLFSLFAAPLFPAITLWMWVLGPVRYVSRLKLAMDGGGIRLKNGPAASYWPFDLIGGGAIQPSRPTQSAVLDIWDANGRAIVSLPLMGERSEQEGASFLAHCLKQRDRLRSSHGGMDRLRRCRRPLNQWVRDIGRLVHEASRSGPYRASDFDPDQLVRILDDPTQDSELKAGVACALLLSDDSFRRSQALERVSGHSPPIVVAAARMAAGANALPDDVIRSVSPYLDDDDRQAMEAGGHPIPALTAVAAGLRCGCGGSCSGQGRQRRRRSR